MVNHGTITGTLSLFKILPLNGFNPIRAKQRLHRTEKSSRKLLAPSQKPQVIYTQNALEFGKSFEDHHGIIELQHLIDPRQTALLKEQYEE